MKIIILLVKQCIHSLIRNIYWLYRLSMSDLGKGTKIEFPIIREGKGILKVGLNGFIGKNVNLGVGNNAQLIFGSKLLLEKDSVILVNKECSLIVGDNFKLGFGSICYVNSDWKLGNNIKIQTNCSISAREPERSGLLIIGDNSNIGDYTIIDLVDNLTIGNNVAIGPNCIIYTHDHIYTDKNLPAWKGGLISKPVIIEDGAWIGAGVTILPGIVIGARAVVAAGSIVTKDVDVNSIFGGNPAKLIKTI